MINFYFPGNYANFKSNLLLSKRDKEIIKENDKKYLTNVGNKKISLNHIGLMGAAGSYVGYGATGLSRDYKQHKSGVKLQGKGYKAKIIGAGIGAGLSGGLSYYLQTRDRDGRSDKGKKRIKK